MSSYSSCYLKTDATYWSQSFSPLHFIYTFSLIVSDRNIQREASAAPDCEEMIKLMNSCCVRQDVTLTSGFIPVIIFSTCSVIKSSAGVFGLIFCVWFYCSLRLIFVFCFLTMLTCRLKGTVRHLGKSAYIRRNSLHHYITTTVWFTHQCLHKFNVKYLH